MVPAALAAAGIASGILGGALNSQAATDAASKQAEQQRQALEYQKQLYRDSVLRSEPYVNAGTKAIGDVQNLLSSEKQPTFKYTIPEFNFSTYQDPGADYQMQRAQRALNSSSLSKGSAGGGYSKALAEKQQELAGTAYNNAFNRYKDYNTMKYNEATGNYDRDYTYGQNKIKNQMGLVTQGLQSETALNQQVPQMGQVIGSTYGNIGDARASGVIGSSNALTTGLGTAINQLAGYYGFNNSQTPGQSNSNLGGQ